MEVAASHQRIRVTESTQPSAARFSAHAAAEVAGFNAEDVYRAGLVATELATNLVKHATDGELLIRVSGRAPCGELELLSIDHGPGILDMPAALSDGHSTLGTSGIGLGAVQRLSDEFDVYSQPGRGTIFLARIRAARKPSGTGRFVFAGVSVALEGETVSGDSWQTHQDLDRALLTVVDGLGHGLGARDASISAIQAIQPERQSDLPALLQVMHNAISHTRGAAAAVAEIRARTLKFAGVGNVAGVIWKPGSARHTVSLSGTLGHEVRHFREYTYPWEPDDLFVMHSDGLTSHWSIDDYRGIRQRHPAIVAAALYRDFRRQRDDVTVVVGSERAA